MAPPLTPGCVNILIPVFAGTDPLGDQPVALDVTLQSVAHSHSHSYAEPVSDQVGAYAGDGAQGHGVGRGRRVNGQGGGAPKTGYSREAFEQAWFDTNRNGCDTRNDVLRRDLVKRDMKNSCKVLAGTLNPEPYTGPKVRFVSGGASEVDIEHVASVAATGRESGRAGHCVGGMPPTNEEVAGELRAVDFRRH